MRRAIRRALAVGGVVLLLLISVSTATSAAVQVPDGPRLAFNALSAFKRSGFTIRTVGPESSRALVLVRGSRRGVLPKPLDGVAWSADGSLLAFTGSKGRKSGIYTVRADGTGLHFLPGTRDGSNPVFSPDGRKVAFTREHLGKGVFLGTTPWVAKVDGSRARRLAEWREGVEYVPSSFSPDGSALAVTRSNLYSYKPKALLFELDGSGSRRVLARFPASDPAFSPDGSQIALVRHSYSRRGKVEISHKDLYLTSIDGAVLARLTRTRWVAETHPSWDSSGQRIAFDMFRISRNPFAAVFEEILPFGNSIAQINVDGTCREKLISLHDAAIYGARWQPGPGREAGRIECGSQVAVATTLPGPRLAVVKVDVSTFRSVLETVDETGALPLRLAGGGERKRPLPEWFTGPAWSPDGSKVVFAGTARRHDSGPRGTRLYVSNADGSGLRPLRGTHGADEPVFAPDGTTVAFTRVWSRGASIWQVDLSGGAPKRLTPLRNDLAMYAKSYSPDGRILLASRSARGRPWDAVALHLNSSKTELLLRGAADPVYSPDGKRIALIRWPRREDRDSETSDLFVMNASGGGLRRLARTPGNDGFHSWDPSGERIAFVRHRREVTELDELGVGSAVLQVNADGSCLRPVLRPAPMTAFYGVAWQPGPGRGAGRIAC